MTAATPPVSGTTEVTPQVPGRQDMEAAVQVIHDNADRLFLWDYERDRGQLVTLYNKAMGSQWNSVTDLDWSIDVDPERLVAEQDSPLLAVARVAGTLPGSPIAAWTDREYTQLGIEMFKANLSQFMHGEQGAMMTAAKIVETVPWIDAKYYASTQTMDEARHTEVFAKYLRTKLGDAYPMSPFLKEQIWSLLEDPRWDIAYLGMQIVIESLALAAFGDMLRRTNEPLLTKLLRYVMSDEARHVAFGVLTLSEFYRELSEPELKERQEFLLDATLNSRARATTPEVWERMGTTAEEVYPFIVQAAQKAKLNPMGGFARGFFAKLVPNVRKLGLLDANNGYLRAVGRGGPARVRVRRRHRLGLRVLRRGGAGPGGGRGVVWGAVRGMSAARSPIARVRAICLALPEAEERPFGGHTAPAFRVRDKLFVMTSEDGTSMTMKAPRGAQQVLVASEPERFFVPKYVGPKGWIGVRLDLRAAPDWDEMAEMIMESYFLTAPKRLAALVGLPSTEGDARG